MSWGELFERANAFDITSEAVQSARSGLRQREERAWDSPGTEDDRLQPEAEGETVRIVADADVLAEDLLVGGPARTALDHVRQHSWVELVASDQVLAEARALIAELTTEELADEWRDQIERARVAVDQPEGDHPALASAYRGDARHLLTRDERLTAAGANVSLQSRMNVSLRPPDSFATLFAPESLYESLFEERYPGPDRDPRA